MNKWISQFFICKYYFIYHKEEFCRCVDEKTTCKGKRKNCNYPIGKKCWEQE